MDSAAVVGPWGGGDDARDGRGGARTWCGGASDAAPPRRRTFATGSHDEWRVAAAHRPAAERRRHVPVVLHGHRLRHHLCVQLGIRTFAPQSEAGRRAARVRPDQNARRLSWTTDTTDTTAAAPRRHAAAPPLPHSLRFPNAKAALAHPTNITTTPSAHAGGRRCLPFDDHNVRPQPHDGRHIRHRVVPLGRHPLPLPLLQR